jgi:hypothetical protein
MSLDAIKFKVTNKSNTSPYRAIFGKTLADQSLMPIRNVTDKSYPAAYLKRNKKRFERLEGLSSPWHAPHVAFGHQAENDMGAYPTRPS